LLNIGTLTDIAQSFITFLLNQQKGTVDELLPLSPPVSITDIGMVTEEDMITCPLLMKKHRFCEMMISSVQPRK